MNAEELITNALHEGLEVAIRKEAQRQIAQAKILLDSRLEEIIASVELEIRQRLDVTHMASQFLIQIRRTNGS